MEWAGISIVLVKYNISSMTATGTIHNVNIQPMTTQISKTIMIIVELHCVNIGCHYVITPHSSGVQVE